MAVRLRFVVLPAAFVALAGCAASYDSQQCYGIDDCHPGSVCFLGTCQPAPYSIQSVLAELTPPASGDLLTQQTDVPLEVSGGYHDIALLPTITIDGSVVSPDGPCSGTLVAKRIGTIPGHDIVRRASVDATSGYDLRVAAGTYAVTFVPSSSSASGTALAMPQPPVSYGLVTFTEGAIKAFQYPASSDLVAETGRLLYSGTSPVEGAFVSGTAQDAEGQSIASSSDVTDVDGTYTLVFPPGAHAFVVSVRPSDANPSVPELTVPVPPSATDTSRLEDVVLGADFFYLDATVKTPAGAPIPNADVFFRGTGIGTATAPASYLAHLTADGQGVVRQAKLFPGQYVVTVVPPKTDPYAVSSREITLAPPTDPSAVLSLQAASKVHLSGQVLNHLGAPVADARVTLSLRDAPTSREYSVQTDATGAYAVDADPGEYDLTVEPALGSADPRYRVLARLSGVSAVLDVQLYEASFVYGRVLDASAAPLGGVNISFYSSDPSSGPTPLLVGVGVTGLNGEFAVPLPEPDDA